ncbi:unnamed protein product, partial [Didymodactylos carnosus]
SFSSNTSIPNVPGLSSDSNLLILSVQASLLRYGGCITFIMVYPTDIRSTLRDKKRLKKIPQKQPFSAHQLDLWCIFEDGSVSPAYSYDSNHTNERVSLLDCPLTEYGMSKLRPNQRKAETILVYVASTTSKDPIMKAEVSIPQIPTLLQNQPISLTLCTSPLHNKAKFLAQWIEFHRLVGITKFVIYNSTDISNELESVLAAYDKDFGLIDVVQWNFFSLRLKDGNSQRYFQVEAVHDCFLRFGDQSEWVGTIDLDEYLVPLSPYETISDFLMKEYRRRVIGSINLRSNFFCAKNASGLSENERDDSLLVVEKFTQRAQSRHKSGRQKYLYRPRFVQYLSIHQQVIGLSKVEPSESRIMLAHYASMDRFRKFPGCEENQYIEETAIRDKYASKIWEGLKRKHR